MWLFYTSCTVLTWAAWATLGKVALRGTSWALLSLLFGLATMAIAAGLLATGAHRGAWSLASLPLAAATGTLGAVGVFTFYLALDKADASRVVPIVGTYPAMVALASVAFLGEKLSRTQMLGVALAFVGVTLVGRGR